VRDLSIVGVQGNVNGGREKYVGPIRSFLDIESRTKLLLSLEL